MLMEPLSSAYHRAKGEQEIELVWTGPSSKLIATRKTEQALLQVIDAAQSRLFITSFVAYDVASIMSALRKAIGRRVDVSMLLESSDKHGGGVSVDGIGQMRTVLPTAHIYFWGDKGDSFAGGKPNSPSPVLWCVSPLRRRSNTPLVQFSPQGGRTPSKIHLIARSRNFTNQKLRKRMIPLATLGPVPDGRDHLGSPPTGAPDLTDTSALRGLVTSFPLGLRKHRRR